MALSTFFRRTAVTAALVGGAGAAALAYAGSHDDEPNPEVARVALVDKIPTRQDALDDFRARARALSSKSSSFSSSASSSASSSSSSSTSPSSLSPASSQQPSPEFDILVIGGGATGTGVALDAATRGLSVALVERDDFASGTSSRSTKLVHGGVRYLERAFSKLDYGQLKLVFEALHERRRLLANAPHLTSELPIMMPCYRWWEVPYFWAGLKAYDAVAGRAGMTMSRYVSPREARRRFPTLSPDGPPGAGGIGGSGGTGRGGGNGGSKSVGAGASVSSSSPAPSTEDPASRPSLKGAIVYSDGQFDDARLCLALAQTAAAAGASVANYAEVTRLMTDAEGGGRVVGAFVRDVLSGSRKEIPVRAKVVINAAGPFADEVRRMAFDAAAAAEEEKNKKKRRAFASLTSSSEQQDQQEEQPQKFQEMIQPSSGVHVTLPDYYSPADTGLIVPKTSDGRVVFLLPWHDATIAGTTDAPCRAERLPRATEQEIDFILDAVKPYLTVKVRRSDVQSAWSGVRPLAADPDAADTASASRDHVVAVDPKTGLLTVAGGKWTTYRAMARDAVDAAVRYASKGNGNGKGGSGLAAARGCSTAALPLVGSAGWSRALFTEVAQSYTVPHRPGAIDTRVARHLASSYGGRARLVTQLAEDEGLGRRLARGHPEIEAEVAYAARHELCETAVDFIARRTRLAFVDVAATEQALPRVLEILAREKGWGYWRRKREKLRAEQFLETFKGGGTKV